MAAIFRSDRGCEPTQTPILSLQVTSPRRKVQHHVDNALSWTMVRVLAASTRTMHWQRHWLQEVAVVAAGTARVDRRMFQQPDRLAAASCTDFLHPSFHGTVRFGIWDESLGLKPLNHALAQHRWDVPAPRASCPVSHFDGQIPGA